MTGFDKQNSLLTDTLIKDGYFAEEINNKKVFKLFSSVYDEYYALRRGVGLRIQMENSILQLTGKDSLDYLHRVSTNNIKELPEGKVAKTILTTDKGRILDCVNVVNLSEKLFLLGHQNTGTILHRWLDKFIITDDVKVENLQNDYILIELLGPQADSFITLLFGKQVEAIEINSAKELYFDISNLYLIKERNRLNELQFKIIIKHYEAVNLINYALSNKGLFELKLIGENAYKIFCIEEGILSANELNDRFNPLEANLKEEISFTKGCYIGQEVVARLDAYDKVQKSIFGFEFERKILVDTFSPILDSDENEVGVVTSTACDCEKDRMIGMGYLKKNSDNSQLHIKVNSDKINVIPKNFPLI